MMQLNRLQSIIPPDQALANKSLATSLQRVAGIQNLSTGQLATVCAGMETTAGLANISAQTTAVPSAVANYYETSMADGSGVNNTIMIVDILGSAVGWNETDQFTSVTANIANINTSYLQSVYTTMYNVVTGVYTIPNPSPPPTDIIQIPSGEPAEGDYNTANDAIAALIVIANSTIAGLVSTYPTQTTAINTDWNTIAGQVAGEIIKQAEAQIVFSQFLANDNPAIQSFVLSLPDYGLQIEAGGMAYFVETLSDTSTQGGQAVIGCLRQGRNAEFLNAAGITTNADIPSNPTGPIPLAPLS